MARYGLLMAAACLLSITGCSYSALQLHWLSPRHGSVAGGTRVYVGGAEFKTDSYNGANLVFIGDIPCDVVWYTVTRWRLECITRPYPGAVEGQSSPWLQARVISGGVQVLPNGGRTTFRYYWDNNWTPQVRTVLPSAAPVSLTQPLIEIAGRSIWPWGDNRYWRFFLGDQLCDHWNHETNRVLGRRWLNHNHYIRCAVQETTPGAWNATVKMNRGTTWNHSTAMMLGYDGKLSMFELYPDVHKVTPSSGSTTGGTLLTITGLGFAETKEDVTVDVGGVPCEVVSSNITVITCWSGVPSTGSEVIANEEGSMVTFTGVDSGLRFKGTRGVKIERSSGSVSSYPPAKVAVFPSFEPARTSRGNYYTERYSSFFTPVQSGEHTFFVSADDKGSLYTANGSNITDLTLIASTPLTPWDRWNYRTQQRSPVLNLTAGEPLLLVADNTEAYGSDYLQVGVLIHDTDFYYNETTQSVREVQYVEFDTDGRYDNQQLVAVVNLTAVDDESPPEFVVAWGNRSTHITLQELQENKDVIPSAVKNLFSGSCSFGQELGVIHFNQTVNRFEADTVGSPGSGWSSEWGGDQPEVVEDESFCGRQSLMVKGSRAQFFNSLSSGFRTSDYPFLCMAYRIPHGLPVTAVVQIKGYGWRSVAMTTTQQLYYPAVGHWDDGMNADSIVDDDKWRYGCTDLHSLLQTSIITNDTTFTITGFGFRDSAPLNTTFHIDELSFSSEKRHLHNYSPPARPNGLALHELLNTTLFNVTSTSLTVNTTLQLVPTSCDHNVPLMEFTLVNTSVPGVDEVSVTRVQSASAPLSGTYSLGFKGHWTDQLPIAAPTGIIKAALESLPSVPLVSVWYHSTHSKDLLGKYCPWRRLYVRFERSPGDQPLMELNAANLMGDGLVAHVKESVTGGLLLWPIPGHMLQTAEVTPQVHVKVKGQRASCLGGHPQYSYHGYPTTDYCGYSYLPSAAPMVSSITPTSAAVGDTITIEGSGFSATPDDNFVMFGEVECTVTIAAQTMMECTLGSGIAGTKTMYLHVLSVGLAKMSSTITLNLELTVTSVSPNMGSTEGGLMVDIVGSGFATPEGPPQGVSPGYSYSRFKMATTGCSSWKNTVTIGVHVADCPVASSAGDQLTCTTPRGMAGPADVTVTVSCTDPGSTAVPVSLTLTSEVTSSGSGEPTTSAAGFPSGFTYSDASTPTVTAIAPTQGTGRGGDTITITGTGFSDTLTGNIVKLGDALCTVQTAAATSITCLTTPHPHGNVPVTVTVSTKGLATSTAEYSYTLHVTAISPCSGSLFGGQAITIDGAGFLPSGGTGVGTVTVAMGDTQCDIQTATATTNQLMCVTRSSAVTRRVDNNVRNPEYGLGYQWEPSSLTITAGDSVHWSWTGSAFTPTKKLVQVEVPDSLQYNGYGFQSEAGVRGSYTHLFTKPGTYHYITEGLAHIGFRGNVTVVPPTTSVQPITITADRTAVVIDAGDICGVTPANQYTFSVADTPRIDSVSPPSVQPGDTLSITARAISTMAAHNMLTIGGKPCTASSHTSITSTEPDTTITTSTYTTDTITITCTVPDVPPGRHWLLLHVAARGWGFGSYNDTTVLVRSSLTAPTPSSGSIRGGLLVSLPVTGLPRNFIGHTTVAIGNTPCLLQDITQSSTNPLTGNAVCLTLPARDDGYSALIKGTALVYWSLQADYFAPNGNFIDQETASFRSHGMVTPLASRVGTVSMRQFGISGNQLTDQSASFNQGHLRVQSFPEFTRLTSFSSELWIKIPPSSSTKYRPIVSSHGVVDGNVPYGFLLLLNPCNQLEYWVSEGVVTATPSPGDCSIISDTSNCPSCASGRLIYSPPVGLQQQLHEGVWHVVTGPVLVPSEQEWVHVVFGFQAQNINSTVTGSANNCVHNSSAQLCTGTQVLYVNKTRYEDSTLYRRVTGGSDLIIGGTNLVPTSSPGSSQLGHFTGFIDEVAVYDHVLEQSVVDSHHHYGSTADQPVIVTTDSLGVGSDWAQGTAEWEPVFDTVHTPIDLDAADSDTYTLSAKTAVQLTWTGYRGVWEVTRSVYMSCDLRATPVRVWAPKQKGGGVLVGLETGQSYYFIDPVGDHCNMGKKVTVTVGTAMEIEWVIGSHDDITVTEGTGLIFRWSGSVNHNVIEMSSARSVAAGCSFVKEAKINRDIGKVVKAWQATPTTSGDVAVTGLSVGKHYFVCTVGRHCEAGMRFTVTVESTAGGGGGAGSAGSTESPQVHTIPWRIQTYPPIRITEGDTLQFAWSAFHSLHQVSKETYTSCNTADTSLYVWGEPSVDNSVALTDLTPGTYYFMCTVSGHCDAGMKLQVTVSPRGVPVLERPLRAVCGTPSGLCSFRYDVEETPELISVEPTTSVIGGGTITLTGRGLISAATTATVGTPATDTTVWIGPTLCNNVAISAITGTTIELQCTVADYELGTYSVDVHVSDKGLASLSSLVYGPVRNASVAVSTYPQVSLSSQASSISPTAGSMEGGTLLTIAGSGFTFFPSRVTVSLGTVPCDVVTATLSEITCRSGASLVAMDTTVPLSVLINNTPASTSVMYSYATTATPTITSLSPGTNLNGGETIEIVGTGFGTIASDLTVQILEQDETFMFSGAVGVACTVTVAIDTSISCTAPTLSAGTYRAVVHVSGRGLARESSADVAMVTYALSVSSLTPNEGGHGGGLELTIDGNGFPTDTVGSISAVTIAVWTVSCRNVQSVSNTQIKCTVDPSGTAPTADIGSQVVVSYRGIDTAPVTFTYKAGLTAELASVTPLVGGTGGGTMVTITGTELLPMGVTTPAEDDVIVTIDSAVCRWHSVMGVTPPTATLITCRTSQHTTAPQAELKVFIKDKGFALTSAPIYYRYIDLWSSSYTWGGLDPPKEGESVHIRAGQSVFLDTDTPVLNLVVIEGALLFYDEQNVHFQAKYIFISGGRLQVGTEAMPFKHQAIISLHGNVRDPEIPIYGAKVIGVRQGELDLHGCHRNITWTRLAQTALNGTSMLHLQQPVDWSAGDRIVVAPTTRDGNETEVHTVLSVSGDGLTVTVTTPLVYTHHGFAEQFENGHYIDIRAEVGLLSHNVIVQGSQLIGDSLKGLGADQYGGQVFVHRTGPHPTPIRIEHTEFRFMGQAFRLGRYAIHFHLSGSMNGSYLRNCAIHHSHNRALTVHGSHDMVVEGNVAYNIKGHTFFIEDGIETNNHYRRNLGVLTRSSSSLLNTDQLPATFWITNPQNTFTDNAAAASRAYGFWYDLDNHPSGPSHTGSVCPNKTPFGTFRNNVAHSCGEFGLRIWERYTPYVDGCAAKQPDNATLYDFTTYANGIHGVELSVVGNVRLVGFKIADNRDNGIEIQETLGEWGGPLIKDSLIVSRTSANTLPAGTGGIKTPNTPYLTISNVTFAAFTQPNTVCLRACSHCKVFQGGYQVWTEQLSFIDGSASNKAAFKWEHEVLFRDLDGTLTGLAGGGWVTPNSGLHPPQYCTPSVPEFSRGVYNGTVCTDEVYFLRMAWNGARPILTLRDIGVNVTNQFGSSVVPWRHYRLTHLDGYMLTLPSTHPHTLTWLLPPNKLVDIMAYSAGLYGLRPVDYVTITHNFVMIPNHVNVGGNRMPTEHGSVPSSADPNHSWHIDNITSNSTTYLISGINQTQQYFNTLWMYSYEPCPINGCPDPPDPDAGPLEDNYRRWSNPDSWPEGELPKEGEEVTISSSWRMLLDLTPPPLDRVFVYGELRFEDERDYNFTANLILVRGGNAHLVIGDEDRRFTHRATITLTGRRNDLPLSLGNQVILGSKAIGVFGNVSMYGQPIVQPWTRLAATAIAGSTHIRIHGDVNDWSAGDQIAIASSSYEPSEAEIRTISLYDQDTQTIVFDEPLAHDHVVHSFLSSEDIEQLSGASSWWNDNGTMAPEVGLLSRNIVIQGGEEQDEPLEMHHYGCRILIGQYRSSTLGVQYSGYVKMESVEVRYCGQGGYHSPRDPRYSIAFRNNFDGTVGSVIRGCSIHHGYNTAIGVHTSNGVTVSRNVVYRTTGSSIIVGGAGSVVTGNLAMVTSTVQPNRPSDNHAVDFPASYDIDRGNTVRDNAAAGTNRISYRYGGERCHDDEQPKLNEEAMFWNNTAHCGLIALVVLGVPHQCTSIAGLTATHHWDYSIFSSTASSLVASHLKLAAGKVGINLNVFGPDPVAHELGGKSVTVLDSLIVGSLPGQSCLTSPPSHVIPGVSFGATEHQLGIMMTCFNKKRSKMDGTGQWHLMKQYPVIDGLSSTIRVTFARFQSTNGCGYQSVAIGNNPLSPDAIHPLHMQHTTKLSVDQNSLVLYYDPNPAWIVQEDCIDMDCDGPKHSLIRDLDGSFLSTAPQEGSVIPRAELRFDNYIDRLPVTWLDYAATPGNGLASPSDVIVNRGVARGHPTDFNAASGGCEWVESWNAYRCQRLQHLMLVIESMDADSEVRRLSPIALVGGDTGGGAYTDLINGPMDHGWCTYYTCLKRLSTFFTLVAAGTNYHLWSTGSLPGNMRFHLLNAEDDDVIMMSVWYKSPLRKDVYRNGIFIEASNVQYESNDIVKQLDDSAHIPSLDDHSGTNYFDRSTQMLHLVIKGSDAIEIRSPPVIRVSFTLDVTIDDFFTTYLIDNLAFVLGIEPSSIRVVKVVAEDTPRPRRSLLAVDNSSTIVLELGEPAELNITEPVFVMAGDEMDDEEGETDSVDTSQNTVTKTTTTSTNPLNDDAPSNLTSFAAQYNLSAAVYIEELAAYIEQLDKHSNITMVVDELVRLVQTGSWSPENATILGLAVQSAPPPAPPTTPVIPPQYENVTKSGNVTIVNVPTPPPTVSTNGGNDDSEVELTFSIPTTLVVSMEPHPTTSHLVYVAVTMLDSSGSVVRNLGLVSKWSCAATLLYDQDSDDSNVPMLGGVTNVTFSNGTAVFTRLRVDRPSSNLRLHFRTFPGHFTALTTVQFTVVSPPTNTTRELVTFTLVPTVGERVPGDYNTLIESIRTAVSTGLGIDISRVTDIVLTLRSDRLFVRLSLLDRVSTDPPDVPTLDNIVNTLEQLVNSQQLQVTVDGTTLVSLPGSFSNSTPTTPTLPIPLIIVISASAGGAMVAMVTIAMFCLCTKGILKLREKRIKKSKVAPQADISFVIETNYSPSTGSGDSNDDDECMLAPLPRPHISSFTQHQLPNAAPITDPTSSSSYQEGRVDPLLANTDCWSTAGTPSRLSQSSLQQRQSVTLAGLANSYPRETTPRPAWY